MSYSGQGNFVSIRAYCIVGRVRPAWEWGLESLGSVAPGGLQDPRGSPGDGC